MMLKGFVLTVVSTSTLFALGPRAYAQQPRPGRPFVERDVCEGEGCRFGRECALAPVRVFRAEGDSTRVAFRLARGDTIQTLEGHQHHRRVGAVLMLRDTTLRDEAHGVNVRVSRHDTIPLLSYSGEGRYHMWLNGKRRVINAFFDDPREYPRPVDRPGKLVFLPEGVWWVSIRDRYGREGWVRMDRDRIQPLDWAGNTCGRES